MPNEKKYRITPIANDIFIYKTYIAALKHLACVLPLFNCESNLNPSELQYGASPGFLASVAATHIFVVVKLECLLINVTSSDSLSEVRTSASSKPRERHQRDAPCQDN
jgi:hypothetical protein